MYMSILTDAGWYIVKDIVSNKPRWFGGLTAIKTYVTSLERNGCVKVHLKISDKLEYLPDGPIQSTNRNK